MNALSPATGFLFNSCGQTPGQVSEFFEFTACRYEPGIRSSTSKQAAVLCAYRHLYLNRYWEITLKYQGFITRLV